MWKWKTKFKKNISGELENYSRQSSLAETWSKEKNTWAVPLVRYSRPFLKWTRDECRQMDQRTRKLMTMHKVLHLHDDTDRLYIPRKERRRGLASIEDSVETSIQRLEDSIEKHKRKLWQRWNHQSHIKWIQEIGTEEVQD